MDISSYIQDLLWDYECVIIPGFGGIMGTYRPADMILAEHTISPPSKLLAFNEYLNNNDGLLVNYISRNSNLSYTEASQQVEAWVKKTKELLNDNEEIYLPKIGRFHRDVEKNLRFVPESSVNYLASSFGLRKVIAEPVLREKSSETIHVLDHHRASYDLPRANNRWAMAAVIVLFLAIGAIANLMYQGVNIQPLNLNAASVLGFMEHFDKQPEIKPEPKASINREVPQFVAQPKAVDAIPAEAKVIEPVEMPAKVDANPENKISATNNPISEPKVMPAPAASVESNEGKKYYIIVGSFKTAERAEAMKQKMLSQYTGSESIDDSAHILTRIGIYAGQTRAEASAKLSQVRKVEKDAWLLVK